jgi:hypothetical protein
MLHLFIKKKEQNTPTHEQVRMQNGNVAGKRKSQDELTSI